MNAHFVPNKIQSNKKAKIINEIIIKTALYFDIVHS